MKTRYLMVTDKIKPIPERLKDQSTHYIDVSDSKFSKSGNSNYWIIDNGEPRPKTAAELKVQQAEIAKENARQEAKTIRNEALQSLTVELDGNVFQTRPSDEVNFRLSIETMGDSEEWILDDNSVIEVTKAQLIQVYSEGLAKSKAIYQVYKEALKAL